MTPVKMTINVQLIGIMKQEYLQYPRDGHGAVELVVALLRGPRHGAGRLRQVRERPLQRRPELGHQHPVDALHLARKVRLLHGLLLVARGLPRLGALLLLDRPLQDPQAVVELHVFGA